MITDHRPKEGHEFDWDNVKILGKEGNYFKRYVSEIMFMKKNDRHLKKTRKYEMIVCYL